jgi:hypothetical protein
VSRVASLTRLTPTDPNGGSAGAMQINYFWCKPSRYYANGYLQAYGLIRTCDDLFDLEDNLRSRRWRSTVTRMGGVHGHFKTPVFGKSANRVHVPDNVTHQQTKGKR